MLIKALLVLSFILNVFLAIKTLRNKKSYKSILRSKEYSNERKIKDLSERYDNLKITHAKCIKDLDSLRDQNYNNQSFNEEKKVITDMPATAERVMENVDNSFLEDEKPIIINLDILKTSKTLIYLPVPFKERRFAKEDESESKKTTSLYIVEVSKDKNEGIISLIESADLSRALNSPNIYLETVCDYENVYSPDAKGIKVVEKGKVVLEGQDWVVKKKIRIKFN
ncbi:hypothetical protein IU405_13015 [Polaribacter sp. BAL334]|uniref:hypothetical protein n=1 Tax=Polaribacter sp. BAL334 TaxID=1708178 RepID=UPI0018D257D1|nr:hypothetical protein [Polaribacter sp. BAL334]MBG7613168.1 hypothetical protein [Polaribacter sp. BAL334]